MKLTGNGLLPTCMTSLTAPGITEIPSIDASSGPIKKVYTVNVEIPDEAGSPGVCGHAAGPKQHQASKYRIVHNRESEDGVLRIEFYEEAAIEKRRSC